MKETLRVVGALTGKYLKDALKNPGLMATCFVCVLFIILFGAIMKGNLSGDHNEHVVVPFLLTISLLFSVTMVVSMATFYAMAEEREKRTLRTLLLTNVSMGQVIAARGVSALVLVGVVELVCYVVVDPSLALIGPYFVVGVVGAVPFTLFSLILGCMARDQATVNLMSIFAVLFGITPMFFSFNEEVLPFAALMPTGGMVEIIYQLGAGALSGFDCLAFAFSVAVWTALSGGALALLRKRASQVDEALEA